MKLFGYNFTKTPAQPKEEKHSITNVESFSFFKSNSFLPDINPNSRDFIKYGTDNLFPNQLLDFYNSSPIHSSIIQQKAKMVIGKGLQLNTESLNPIELNNLNRFINFIDGEKDIDTLLKELSFDYQLFGAFAIEIYWNSDFTKIIQLNRIPVMQVRLGAENENGKVDTYYISKDWKKNNSFRKIPAFNILNKSSQVQLMYLKNESADARFYGVPSYISGLNWVASDSAISKFHLSNINQGFAPSLKISFYKKPESDEQKNQIVNNIKAEYSGQQNAGKAMIFFSDSKETAPDISPISVSELDKQFTVIADQIVDQIIRSHRGVSPILWGVKTAGQLGGASGEFEIAYNVFEKNVIAPERIVFEKLFNRIFKINGWNVSPKLIPFDSIITSTSTTPTNNG